MSAAVKGGDYVLTASVLRLRGEHGAPRRYKRGDTVTLTAEQAERFLAARAVAKPSADEAKAAEDEPGGELADAPPAPAADAGQVAGYAAAAANSGLGVAQHPALSPAAGDPPPKAALVDAWRAWAVDAGKVTEAEAAEMNKGDLQALAAK